MSKSKKRPRGDATTAKNARRHQKEEKVEAVVEGKVEQNDPPFDCQVGKDFILLKKLQEAAIPGEFPVGCGKCQLAADHVEALRTLCHMIVDKLGRLNMVSWGEGLDVDKKARGYGMLADSQKWSNVHQLVQAGILLHHEDAENDPDPVVRQEAKQKHKDTKSKAFTSIHLTDDQIAAVNAVITSAQDIVTGWPSDEIKSYERACITLSELVAIQPNVHNNDPLLPLHLDQPRNDGFGVVIVTVGIQGSGDIVLDDPDDDVEKPPSWSFPLQAGEMYVLCGPSRNLCR